MNIYFSWLDAAQKNEQHKEEGYLGEHFEFYIIEKSSE
jgi:hypothetical protein